MSEVFSVPRLIRAGFLSALFWLGTSPSFANSHPAIVVVANVDGIDSLDGKELERIFKMRQQSWPNKQQIKVFTYGSDSALFQAFSQNLLNMNASQLQRVWNRLVFTGLGIIPVEVSSEIEMMKRIKETPGSIGYMSEVSAATAQMKQLSLK